MKEEEREKKEIEKEREREGGDQKGRKNYKYLLPYTPIQDTPSRQFNNKSQCQQCRETKDPSYACQHCFKCGRWGHLGQCCFQDSPRPQYQRPTRNFRQENNSFYPGEHRNSYAREPPAAVLSRKPCHRIQQNGPDNPNWELERDPCDL